ncbi:hypothetical protein [uncultured Christiangramia sp.]|uniref:hypothetical protein n=1 Tax=Christiangramia sp. 3-2217-3z TaxID=3417564 RepID=UPI002633DAC5|nr:hypothetical protein [uncultured Christiangramia sp.]
MKEKFSYPVLAIITANILIALGGQLFKDDWTTFYSSLPTWAWVITFIGIVIIVLVFLIKPKNKIAKKNFNSGFVVHNQPILGYQNHSKLNYKNVDWLFVFPKSNSWNEDGSRINPDILETKEYPYCPNCKNIELDEKKSFLGKYVWSCIGCGFKISNKISAKEESKNALKIGKNEYIKSLNS